MRAPSLTSRIAVVVAVGAVLVAVGCSGPKVPTPSATPGATVSAMPVLSVADARALLNDGALSGRAVAVGGFWGAMAMGCPATIRQPSPLEAYCQATYLADDNFALCRPMGNGGTSCSTDALQGRPYLSPLMVTESSERRFEARRPDGSVPLIVVGHAADPRLWQCPADVRPECARRFVVDYIGPPDAQLIEVVPPDVQVAPTIDVAAAATVAGVQLDSVIAAIAVPANEVAALDPRFNLSGADIVWVVRSIRLPVNAADATRPMTVTLVDDATTTVIDSADMAMADDFQPARLEVGASQPAAGGNVNVFYDLRRADGQPITNGLLAGRWSNEVLTQHGPTPAIILPPGDYEVSAWIGHAARADDDPFCSIHFSLEPLDDTAVEAAFPGAGPCHWVFVQPDRPRF